MELPKFLDPKLITDDFAASGRIAQGVRISEQAGPSEKIVR